MDSGIHWPSLVMGWPALGLAGVLFAVGLGTGRWWVAAIGATVALPFCVYLTLAFGVFVAFGPLVAGCNVAAVVALRNARRGRAAALLLPFAVVVLVLGVVVLSPTRRFGLELLL